MNKTVKRIIISICIFILIVIILIVFRNFMVISKISEASNKYSNLDVYSYEIHNIRPNESHTKIYRKGQSSLYVKEDVSILYNSSTNETTIKNLKSNEITTTSEGHSFVNVIPSLLQGDYSFFDKLVLSFDVQLKTEKINNQDCYVLKNKNDTTYIYKDACLVAKVSNANTEIEYLNWNLSDGADEISSIIEKYSK